MTVSLSPRSNRSSSNKKKMLMDSYADLVNSDADYTFFVSTTGQAPPAASSPNKRKCASTDEGDSMDVEGDWVQYKRGHGGM